MKRNWDSATLLLVALTCLALYLSYVIFRPFAGAILFAMVIAIIFHPVHRHSRRLFRSRNSAALVSTLLATFLTAIPLFLIGFAVSSELVDLYHSVSARSGANGGIFGQAINAIERLVAWAAQRFGFPALDVHSMIMERLGEASTALVHFGAGVARNLFSIFLKAVIAVVVLFFLFRDGEANLSRLSSVLPMSRERFLELQSRVSATVIANFYGGVAVGAAQGTLTALAFWALGIQSPILWGVVTALFSLVPITGSASVWLPASIILAFTGHLTKGIILLAWGAAVVGTVDNIIRPWIISGRVQLRTIYVFFALLGGVQAFGIVGFFVGPVILSVTVALLGMLKEDLSMHTSTSGQGELLEKDNIPQTRSGGVAGR